MNEDRNYREQMLQEPSPAPALTGDEWDVLEYTRLRPNGMPFRHPDLKAAVKSLADRQLVCDPHTLEGGALFTRITEEGKAALAANRHRPK